MVWVCPKCGYVNEDEDEDDDQSGYIGTYKTVKCKMCGEPRWYTARRW